MIHLIKKYTIATALSALVLTTGCDEEEKNVSPVSAQFTVGSITTSEAGAEQTITLPFSDAIMANGTIEITFTADDAKYGEDFVTIPGGSSGSLKLNVTKGQTAAQFKVVPVDNDIMNEVSTVKLTLSNPSDALAIGSQSEVNITFTDNEGPTKVDFGTDVTNLYENAAEATEVEVLLTSPATGPGTTIVSVTTNGVYGTDFTTVPAVVDGKITLTTEIGEEQEVIVFQPIDNDNVSGTVTVEFEIESATGGVEVGVNTSHTVTVTDDETPSTATFTQASKILAERNTDGFTVPVSLSPTLSKAGTLQITIASTATYNTHYTTIPAAVNGVITLNIAQGASETSFQVIPVNDDAVNADRQITFSMSASTGVVVIGDSNDEFAFTAYDDDEITSLADLRALYTGTDVTLPTGTVISGVVISKADNVSGTDLHIQDGTAGLLVTFAANHGYVPTDELKIDLTGSLLGEVSGVLIGGKNNVVANDNAIKLGTAALPVYQTVTITEFNSNLNAYESELVQIENAGFPDADGTLKLTGSVDASNGIEEFIVRTEASASWSNTVVPYGLGVIRGVASEASGISRLLPQVYADDIAVVVDARLITVTQSISHFGYIKKGAESAVQQFTINGANLVNDLTVTSPSYFMISKDNATFSNSLTYTAAEVSADQTVYMKFAPNAVSDGALTGSLIVKSFGAASKSYTVNGIQGIVLDENFSYAASDGDGLTVFAAGKWARHSGNTDPKFTSTGLSYTDYPSTAGGAITFSRTSAATTPVPAPFTTADGDVNRAFISKIDQTSDVYISFLVNLSSTSTSDYFFHLGPSTIGSTFRSRVFAFTNGGGWSVGLSKANEAATSNNAVILNYNQTYLFVIKYSYNTSTPTDDLVSLYVYDSAIPASEASTNVVSVGPVGAGVGGTTATADLTDVGSVAVRQGTNTPTGTIDGIRVAKSWTDLFN
jgi:hypothetical protein